VVGIKRYKNCDCEIQNKLTNTIIAMSANKSSKNFLKDD